MIWITQWCVHQNGRVEFSGRAGDAHSSHLIKSAQRVTSWEELGHISLFQGSGDQHHHVVNHVTVSVIYSAKSSKAALDSKSSSCMVTLLRCFFFHTWYNPERWRVEAEHWSADSWTQSPGLFSACCPPETQSGPQQRTAGHGSLCSEGVASCLRSEEKRGKQEVKLGEVLLKIRYPEELL